MKTHTEIANGYADKINGKFAGERDDYIFTGEIEGFLFGSEAALKAYVDCVNSQNSEAVAEVSSEEEFMASDYQQPVHWFNGVTYGKTLYTSPQPSQDAEIATLRQQLAERDALIAELSKNDKRYRYMRDNTSVMTFEEQTWVTSHKLDMRIDKAMKGE